MDRDQQLPPGAVHLYQQGVSLGELARRYETSPQTVGRRLQAAGVHLRPRGTKTEQHRAAISARRSVAIDESRLRELAGQGLSTQEIGGALGVSEETVRRRMVRLDIPRLAGKARPERNAFWRGGRTQDRDGYWLVRAPGHPYATKKGYVREHRLVMERQLGRYLESGEVVDHIDGNRSNNNQSNLQLFASNAEHLRATLAGQLPNWTEDGQRRIQAGVQRAASLHAASRSESRIDARP